jgi:adenylosuccinate lyase
MGNMSYCRFENTLKDLRDCYKDMSETDFNELSETEQQARNKLIALCKDISEQYEEEEIIDED